MQTEFYVVEFDWGDTYYFRDKDNAFAYAKQAYLNAAPYNDEKEMEEDLASLNENYYIHGFVCILVNGFED